MVVILDESAPFSSDKIRAKILDLGYGGARHEAEYGLAEYGLADSCTANSGLPEYGLARYPAKHNFCFGVKRRLGTA